MIGIVSVMSGAKITEYDCVNMLIYGLKIFGQQLRLI